MTINGVPKDKADEINEVFALLGLAKPSDAKLKEAADKPAYSGQ